MKEIKVNEYWLKLFKQVENSVEDFATLFEFWKAGDATEEETKEAHSTAIEQIEEAEFKGKEVSIGKPKRGGSKAYYVYVMDGDKVKKVSFGSGGLRAKIKDPKKRKAFAARHNCDQKKDRTTAGYWSCNVSRYRKKLGLKSSSSW